MKRSKKRFVTVLSALFLIDVLLRSMPLCAFSENTPSCEEIMEIACGIIDFEKAANGSSDSLLEGKLLLDAGTPAADWYAFALSRLGIELDRLGYLAMAEENIATRYRENGSLDASMATEWHRIILSMLACGGDPTAVALSGTDYVNLVADGIYDRQKTVPLDRQGINGFLWGLIALDSIGYEVPADACDTREDIIIGILSEQLPCGGFALWGTETDVDITAMVLTALAPYYNDETMYSYTDKASDQARTSTVREAVDLAVAQLSALQYESGDFAALGIRNLESTCQVATALCSLGINPFSDARFIKNGNSVWDGILLYRTENGGFVHSLTSSSATADRVANRQALYTAAALFRYRSGMRSLFDLRGEMSEATKAKISALCRKISDMNGAEAKEVKDLLAEYFSLPESVRRYVYNYYALSDAARVLDIDITQISLSVTAADDDSETRQTIAVSFDAADAEAVNLLPDTLTGEQYVTVVKLLYKAEHVQSGILSSAYMEKLVLAKGEIELIRENIKALCSEIEALPPIGKISLSDRKAVNSAIKKYKSLSEYDKSLVEEADILIAAKAKTDTAFRTVFLTVFLIAAATAMIAFICIRIRGRLTKREREMELLAKAYESEDDE